MGEHRLSDTMQLHGEESDALPTDLTGSFHSILPSDSTEQSHQFLPPIKRFLATVAVLLTIGLSLLVDQVLLVSPNPFMHVVGVLLCVFLTVFAMQWSKIYSNALTLRRRAFFDEANILDTYTPRDPNWQAVQDPPTPAPTDEDERLASSTNDSGTSDFDAMRNKHYENMFDNAQRIANELEALKRAEENSTASEMTEQSPEGTDKM